MLVRRPSVGRRSLRGRSSPRRDSIRRRPLRSGTITFTTYLEVYEQGYRIADASLALYELFVGYGVAPDFTAPPVATSATLPFSWTPTLPSSGTETLYVVVRQRNKYGLESFNVFEDVVEIVAHVETLGPITAPLDVAVYDAATGFLNVVAKYSSADDANPADTWLVYCKLGADPVPGTDSPAFTGPMTFLGVETAIAQVVGPYTPGAVAHVIVVAERSADGATAAAAVVLHTLALSLDLTNGSMFGGAAFEQQ